ncbi:MAG: magnesium/cobalt transporter CorA [Elusimicrobia bacterium]|nr:magnesium/cobalt transporter CorA [Elusimicrobiota bacterium]
MASGAEPGAGGAPPAPAPAAAPKLGRRARRRLALERRFRKEIGAVPGITVEELAKLPSSPEGVRITCIDYSAAQVQAREVKDLPAFLGEHRPSWTTVRWINIDGLGDMRVIEALAKKYQLHPLAVEDLIHRPQRPKVDAYGGGEGELQARLFVIARMLRSQEGGLLDEQVSIFLGHSTVITFQEYDDGDVWDAIRGRIRTAGSRLRQNEASFLVYALLDAIVDHCFPVLEAYGDRLEELEASILASPDPEQFAQIHRLKREMLLVRRAVWPMRELVGAMQRETHECLSDTTKVYLRDVYDHSVQIIDILETYREVAIGLTETYMTVLSNRLNEVMKVLTMISVIFIPVTFLSSVFGMNFTHFAWDLPHAIEWFFVICLCVTGGMLYWFKRRGWI